MGIKDFVYGSRLQNQARFGGRVSLKATDQDGLVNRMLEMGTSLTKTLILAVLTLLVTAVGNVSREGFKINIEDFLQVTPAIDGLLKGKEGAYDPTRKGCFLTPQGSQTFNRRFALETHAVKVTPEANRPPLFQVEAVDQRFTVRPLGTIPTPSLTKESTRPSLFPGFGPGSPSRGADRWAGPPCLTVSVATTDCLCHIH